MSRPSPIGLPAEAAWAGEAWAAEQPAAAPILAHHSESDDEPDVDVDFDEMWGERRVQRGRPPRIRILGRIYELPHAMPAKLILFGTQMAKRNVDPASAVGPEKAQELLGCLLGDANVTAILGSGIDMEQLEDVLTRCMEIYKRRQATQGNRQAAETRGPAATS